MEPSALVLGGAFGAVLASLDTEAGTATPNPYRPVPLPAAPEEPVDAG